jgi:hypothetical protein
MRGISLESLFKNMPGCSMAAAKLSRGVQFLFNVVQGGVDRGSHSAGARHRFGSFRMDTTHGRLWHGTQAIPVTISTDNN